MSSQAYSLLGIGGTVAAGVVARRLITAQHAFAGSYFSVAAWIAAAGLLAAGCVAYLAPRRPYVAGTLTGAAGIIVAAAVVFWTDYDPMWAPVAVAVAFGAGAFGAFLGIASRWMIRGGRPAGGGV